MFILILLLILWVALIVIGFMFKALLWLAIVGLVFLALTIVLSAVNHSRTSQE